MLPAKSIKYNMYFKLKKKTKKIGKNQQTKLDILDVLLSPVTVMETGRAWLPTLNKCTDVPG